MKVCKAFPDTKVIMLSAHSDDAYIDQAVAVGAAGYLFKQDSSENLSDAIREVQKRNVFFSPSISTRLQNQKVSARGGTSRKKVARLSSRQMEVLQLIAEGKTNNTTATELGISTKTVEKHRQILMAKLNIHEISGLTRYAIAAGIIENSVQLANRNC